MPIDMADKRARWRAMLWLLVLTLPLLLLLDQLEPQLQQWSEDPARIADQLPAILLFLYILFLPMMAFCAWLWLFGRRIITGQRFPPRGSLVIRDTPVIEGASAVRRGRVLQLLALVLAALFILLPLAFTAVLQSLI